MKFNKININRAPLTAEDFQSAMDFDGVLNPKAPASSSTSAGSGGGKLLKLSAYAVGAVLIGVAAFLFYPKNLEHSTQHAPSESEVSAQAAVMADEEDTPVINPPFKKVDLPFETCTVSATEASDVNMGSSRIHVPEDCFVDEEGNPVSGEVDLKYREFNTTLDIFLSGIPMAYDSAGVSYTFESNGMFEIRGYQNGKPVYVAPDKAMAVAMEIEEKKPGFNEYFLNEETGAWEYRNPQRYEETKFTPGGLTDEGVGTFNRETALDTVIDDVWYGSEQELGEESEEVQQIDKAISQARTEKKQLKKPVKPKKSDPQIPQLALDVDYADFPELRAFKNTLFQVAEKDLGTFDAKWGEEIWNDINVSKSSIPGNYKIVFSKPGKRIRVNCAPVVSEEDLPKAMAIYDDLFTQYEQAVDSLDQLEKQKERERREALKKAREESLERARLAAKQRRMQNEEAIRRNRELSAEQKEAQKEAQRAMSKRFSALQKVSAMFSANGFGYYNCDSAIGRIYRAEKIIAEYESSDGATISQVNLVEKDRRAVLTRYQKKNAQFNPDKENTFFCVTSENKLAVAKVEQRELKGKKRCVIKMKSCDEEITSKKQVENFLKEEGIVL